MKTNKPELNVKNLNRSFLYQVKTSALRVYRQSRLRYFICLALLTVSLSLQAQKVSITGTVTDESGEPLPGVTIVIKGQSSAGTSTRTDGTYKLREVPADATISFSFIGYKTVEVPVNGRTRIDIQLVTDVTAIEEVIVNAGYYIVKDRERTGSIVKEIGRASCRERV